MQESTAYTPAYSVFKTKSYGLFSLIQFNRIIDEQHVARLMKEIQQRDLLAEFPILVNDIYEVLDGQHRLEAARRLDKEVYFIKSENLKLNSISRINSTQKPWKILDYIEWFANTGNQEYTKLLKFINTHDLEPSLAIDLLRGYNTGDKGGPGVKDGTFKVRSEEWAETVVGYIKTYAEEFSFRSAWSTYFVRAVMALARLEGYDHAQMMRKVADMPRRLVKCPDMKGYIEMLLEIYNHHAQRKLEYKKK